jgi:hypothetical protein
LVILGFYPPWGGKFFHKSWFIRFSKGDIAVQRSRMSVVFLAVWLVLGMVCLAQAAPEKVSQVVYITKSKACGCSAKSVKAADAAVAQVFAGPRQTLLKRIDYDTDRQAAVPYIGEFHLIQLPALLFLDRQGHLLWSAIGSVDLNKLEEKMKEFGA